MDGEEKDANLTSDEVTECRNWLVSVAEKYARKVHPLYFLLQWKWRGAVPDVTDIEVTLGQLARSVSHGGPESAASTGGLTAWVAKRADSVTCGFRFSLEVQRFGLGPDAPTNLESPDGDAKESAARPPPFEGRSIVL